MFTFIELSGFSKHRKDLLSDDEFSELQRALIANPECGSTISGTGGFRKLRWSRPGMGKSGGVRVIYYNLSTQSGRLYLALIYSKNEADNITDAQKSQLMKVSGRLK
ncbi:RelE toxin of RelE / RelB toxin-antitoxin system [Amphritea atlantica]|jgi:hypothetical protein|uniref:RelE toxin of RelE / RelB toxin-antitoxin system n=1 Tax=Amphritea atlantica TaxID=355243 RepID=A0A1H9GJK4_9GAMM|nr:RelE toxin of RelE / RelB toxin-antitoxin system [Amphritea atlantica]